MRAILFDRAVDTAMGNLIALERGRARLASLSGRKCSGCRDFAVAYAEKTVARAERSLARTSSRVLRVARRRMASGGQASS